MAARRARAQRPPPAEREPDAEGSTQLALIIANAANSTEASSKITTNSLISLTRGAAAKLKPF